MTNELEYRCINCGHEGINTRAVPDVPELVVVSHEVFYAPTREWRKTSLPDYYRNNDNLVRDLVDKDQAAAVIAAKVKIGEEVADKIFADYTTQLLLKEDAIKRAEAAEAKLIEWEKVDRLVAKALWEDKVKVLEAKLAQIEKQGKPHEKAPCSHK